MRDTGLDLFFGGPTGLFSKALRDAAGATNIPAMKAQGMQRDVIWKHITNCVVEAATRNAEGQCKALKHYGVDYLQGSVRLLAEDDEENIAMLKHFEDELDHLDDGLRSVHVSDCPIIDGEGNVIEGSETTISSTKVLLCTGSKSTRLPSIPFEHSHRIFESDTITLLDYLPRSVTIAGLGLIGIEFANIFVALGVEDVNIICRGDVETAVKKLNMDMDVANELMRLLTKSGVKVLEKTTIDEFTYIPTPEDTEDFIEIKLSDGSTMETDLFLAATGRTPVGNDEGTGLTAAGVTIGDGSRTKDKGRAHVDDITLATSSRNVYAAGDIIGGIALASTGKVEAKRAVFSMFSGGSQENLAGKSNFDDPLDPGSVGVWTIPAMGYYGLTKEAAKAEGRMVVEGISKYDKSLRGRVFAPDGLLKLVVDANDGTVLGVHLIGKEAAELIHFGVALVKQKMSIFEVLSTTFTAVTYHELYKYAALDANSKLEFGVEWQEIFAALQLSCSLEPNDDFLHEKFDEIDKDGSGTLDRAEVKALIDSLGRPVSKRVISNIMRLSDSDGDGVISFDDFKKLYKRVCGTA